VTVAPQPIETLFENVPRQIRILLIFAHSGQSRLFLHLLEVDDGSGGADASASADPLWPVLLAVTSLAIQLHTMRSHVLQFQHFIAQIAFEACLMVLVVADHDFFSGINRFITLGAFCRLDRFERHL